MTLEALKAYTKQRAAGLNRASQTIKTRDGIHIRQGASQPPSSYLTEAVKDAMRRNS